MDEKQRVEVEIKESEYSGKFGTPRYWIVQLTYLDASLKPTGERHSWGFNSLAEARQAYNLAQSMQKAIVVDLTIYQDDK